MPTYSMLRLKRKADYPWKFAIIATDSGEGHRVVCRYMLESEAREAIQLVRAGVTEEQLVQ
jgi:hypothetical protein